MQFKSIKWPGAVALSTAILMVFVYGALRAEDNNNSAAAAGASSVLKIKDQSAPSTAEEADNAATGAADKASKGISTSAKSKADPKDAKIRSTKSAEDASSDIIIKNSKPKPRTAAAETKTGKIAAHAADQLAEVEAEEKIDETTNHDETAPATEEKLEPVPNPDEAGPAVLETASFKGVTPGVTSLEEVEKLWGAPKEIFKQNDLMTQLYSIEPFDRVEVSYQKDHQDKVSSIIIRFEKPFPADKIAQQLDMASVKPALVSNEMAEILGQVYPERGVLLAFEPSPEKSKPSMKVTHIILEPLNAEPFILRAETEMDNSYDLCLHDLEQALNLQGDNARANWLLSRVLSAGDQLRKAEAASAKSVRLEPDNPRYRITRAQILGQVGRLPEGIKEAQKAVEISNDRPHIQARALCLLGDFAASGPKPDYRKAINYHTRAIQAADAVSGDPHPAVRLAAKEVLVDAHLGALHDIAWGDWKDKDVAVSKWLERAASFADDLVRNEGGSEENLFRVYTRALTACVGLRGKIDPKPWIQEALTHGDALIDSASDPVRKAQYQWDLGLALYDAVQIYQLRLDHAAALKYAQSAAEYLEKGHERKQTLTTAYVLGRLYFRMGAIHAIRDKNHEEAIVWFDKAAPLLMKPLPPESDGDLGREGETFVSMGVSFWEAKQRDKAVELTQHGISLIEEAIRQGTLERTALVVPYNNISVMHRQLGSIGKAERYQEMAAKIKDSKVK
jgi:tetratricopeptide (TPR) repeat protein